MKAFMIALYALRILASSIKTQGQSCHYTKKFNNFRLNTGLKQDS